MSQAPAGRSAVFGLTKEAVVLSYGRPIPRTHMHRFVILFVAVLLTAPGLSAAQSSDSVAIHRLDSLWARMYQQHDTIAALELYSERLAFTSANGARKTREQELHDVRPAPGLVMQYFRTTPSEIRVQGNRATVSGAAEWAFTMGGRERSVRRGYAIEYERGGPLGWQIVAVTMKAQP
jgi:hypothetical protein